jgi:hypothetical protein
MLSSNCLAVIALGFCHDSHSRGPGAARTSYRGVVASEDFQREMKARERLEVKEAVPRSRAMHHPQNRRGRWENLHRHGTAGGANTPAFAPTGLELGRGCRSGRTCRFCVSDMAFPAPRTSDAAPIHFIGIHAG